MVPLLLVFVISISVLHWSNGVVIPKQVRGSELVKIPTMGQYSPVLDVTPSNCPHQSTGMQTISGLTNGQDLVIVAGTKMLLTASSLTNFIGVIRRITVSNQATLIFDDVNMDLHVNEIVVQEGGSLLIGSETCRMNNLISITFHGSMATSSTTDQTTSSLITPASLTSKGMLIYGQANIHGKLYHPTWTRLSATASAGTTTIWLQDRVNWVVGQTIVITTSIPWDCHAEWQSSYCKNTPHQNELHTITSVNMDAVNGVYSIVVDQPFVYHHYAGLEYQAEVALLSRNIVFKGEQSNDSFGGHLKVIGQLSSAKISGVQAENMGQLNIMGRYPFHFHMMFESAGAKQSYFQDCSVTNSNFRCYTVHGTNSTRLSRNVAYNAKGMCYYFEDGVEERNLVEFNFASHINPIYKPADGGYGQGGEWFTQSTSLVNPADTSASGFYFLNAYNTIIGNAVSGGWSGFAFPNAVQRVGLFKGTLPANTNLDPLNRPLLKFSGNSAHSCGFYWVGHGSCIYFGAKLDYDSTGTLLVYNSGRNSRDTFNQSLSNPYHYNYLEQTKVFLCNKGIAHWGNDVRIDGMEAHDFTASAMLFGRAAIHNALINMKSYNPAIATAPNIQMEYYGNVMGFQFYDTWVQSILSNITFRHISNVSYVGIPSYDPAAPVIPEPCALRYLDHSDKYTPQGINSVNKMKFEHVRYDRRVCIHRCGATCEKLPWDGQLIGYNSMSSKIYSILDFDGSLLGTNTPTILGSNRNWWTTDDNSCTFNAPNNIWTCPFSFAPWGIKGAPNVPQRITVFFNILVNGIIFDWNIPCDTVKFPSCTDQFLPYTVARVGHFNRAVDDGSITLGPSLGGITGLSNQGWYWRAKAADYGIDGAPSSFSSTIQQMARGAFVVVAIAYPPNTQFTVSVNFWGSANYVIPMSIPSVVLAPEENLNPSTSFVCNDNWSNNGWFKPCTNTGGSGLQWHFDGKHLFIRMVNYFCYTVNNDQCDNMYFDAYGAKVGNIKNFNLQVTATCVGCAIQSSYAGVNYFTVADVAPAKTVNDYSYFQKTNKLLRGYSPSAAPV